jgi:dethiobiotin synthetase
MGGFAKRLGLPVLVVARAGLGTINHSLLTVEAAEREGCTVTAVVLSVQPEDDLEFSRSNAEQIARAWPGRVVVFVSAADLAVLL